MEGIIVISCFNQPLEAGLDRASTIIRAGEIRLRAVLITCSAACLGLLPAAVATGIGSQVQKPLALVVVDGILLVPSLILVVLPELIEVCSRQAEPPQTSTNDMEPAE